MGTARAVIFSGLLIAAVIAGAAWMLIRSQVPPSRYQLINVGRGETQRLDMTTGTLIRCVGGACEVLTNGASITAIQPPVGFHLDN